MYRCENCGQEFSEKYLRVCDDCLPLVDKNKLKKYIVDNMNNAKYFDKYDYHKRIEMAEYHRYIEKADRYTKALNNKLNVFS